MVPNREFEKLIVNRAPINIMANHVNCYAWAQKNKKRAHLGIHKVNRNSHNTKLVQSRASQLAIRVDSIRYANLFESILFVKTIGLSIH